MQKSILPQQRGAGSINGNKLIVTTSLQCFFSHWGEHICPYHSFERGPDALVRTFMKLFIRKDHWLKVRFFPACSLPILTMRLRYLGKKYIYKPECWGITSQFEWKVYSPLLISAMRYSMWGILASLLTGEEINWLSFEAWTDLKELVVVWSLHSCRAHIEPLYFKSHSLAVSVCESIFSLLLFRIYCPLWPEIFFIFVNGYGPSACV